MKEDGTMARMPDLIEFAEEHDLHIVTIADLIAYRIRHDLIMHRTAEKQLPGIFGDDWRILSFTSEFTEEDVYVALIKGEMQSGGSARVWFHDQNFVDDIIEYFLCNGEGHPRGAMAGIEKEGKGILLYLSSEGKSLDLFEKIESCSISDRKLVSRYISRTFSPDLYNYVIAAQILKYIGIKRILTEQKNIKMLEPYGFNVDLLEANA